MALLLRTDGCPVVHSRYEASGLALTKAMMILSGEEEYLSWHRRLVCIKLIMRLDFGGRAEKLEVWP